MRVIAGEYRRRILRAPAGMATRPTSDRLRETLFNVLGQQLKGASFLDLYAGSGANGIEALSRGAARTVFVDQAAPALTAIHANLAALRIDPASYAVEAGAVPTWLRRVIDTSRVIRSRELRFDLVFLDPPYDDAKAYTDALTLLGREAASLLADGAVVIAEHRRSRRTGDGATVGDRYARLQRTRMLEQGDAALSFYSLQLHEPGHTPTQVQDAAKTSIGSAEPG